MKAIAKMIPRRQFMEHLSVRAGRSAHAMLMKC